MPQAGQSTGNDGYTEDDVPMMSVGPPTVTDPNQVSSKPRQMPGDGAGDGAGGMGGGFGGEDPMAASGDLGAGAPDDETGLQAPLPGGEPNDPAAPAGPMGGAAPAPGTFDPAASGGPEQQQHAETSGADAENTDGDADDDGDDDASEPDNGNGKKKAARRARANRMLARTLADNPGMSRQAALAVVKQAMVWGEVGDGAFTRKITDIPIRHAPIGPNPWGGPRQQLDENNNPVYDMYGNPVSDGKHHPGFVQQHTDKVLNHVTDKALSPMRDRIRDAWKNRPVRNRQPAEQDPETEDSAPEPGPSAPAGPPSPSTVGEFARQQMQNEPRNSPVRQDLWKQRFSEHPMGSAEPEAPRPFGTIARRR